MNRGFGYARNAAGQPVVRETLREVPRETIATVTFANPDCDCELARKAGGVMMCMWCSRGQPITRYDHSSADL
jgi:hypothetical protein